VVLNDQFAPVSKLPIDTVANNVLSFGHVI